MSKEDSGYLRMFPAFAKLVFIVEKAEFFNNIVHDKIGIYLWFISHMFLISFTQLTYLVNVKSLVRINFQHPYHQTSQFLTVSLWRGWEITFGYPLEKLVKI